ncbi:MAG TPA: hypothetical protein VFS21_08865 [Roseiflexaceae bacterium]|nr:hypothetical protein [Roseiflexaceae bacterium]
MEQEHEQQDQAQTVRAVADALGRSRLEAPARLLLDVIAPVDFLASQVASFTRPLLPFGQWRSYVAAFENEECWALLRRMVDQQDR